MDIELIEIRDFLAEHPPFDHLPTAILDGLPRRLSVRYLRRDSVFPPADADTDYLYIIRTGAVELRGDNGQLLDKFGEGDLYTSPCLEDHPQAAFHGLTSEDTLFYQLPCRQLAELRQAYPDFDAHFTRSFRDRLRRALDTLQSGAARGGPFLNRDVGELLTRPPVTVSPGTSLRQAAQTMTEAGVSALLVMANGRLEGIVTDRDLRARGLAQGLPYGKPVADIMTRQLHQLSKDMPAFEALMIMTRLNIHHLPVFQHGAVVGMISATDLLRAQSINSIYLVGDIHRSENVAQLAKTCAQLPRLHLQLMAAGATAEHLGQTITAVSDAATQRLLQLAEKELGAPPVAYAWLAVGSQARREQTVHSDQDNALLLADDDRDAHAAYFTALARFVNDGLARCGFAACPGEVMASNPDWRQPRRVWRRYFDDWITRPEPKALMLASNFFDARVVHGDLLLYERLQAEVLQQARDNQIFLAHLAANAIRQRPPLGFFRNLVLIGGGEHAKSLDLKQGGIMPIIDLGRVYALSAGIAEINTAARLDAAAQAGTVTQESAANLKDALALLTTLRARHQAEQLRTGRPPDNYLEPAALSRLEREYLKDAFAVIKTLQDALSQAYQAARFF